MEDQGRLFERHNMTQFQEVISSVRCAWAGVAGSGSGINMGSWVGLNE